MLSLLAQQEMELGVFRSSLEGRAGVQAVAEAEAQAAQRCVERYGAYISTREDVTDEEEEEDRDERGGLLRV